MADAAHRILMKELKDLKEEKWTNIEVRSPCAVQRSHLCGGNLAEYPANLRHRSSTTTCSTGVWLSLC